MTVYVPRQEHGAQQLLRVARILGGDIDRAGALPYDEFVEILLVSNAEGMAEQDWHKDEDARMESERKNK